MFRNLRYKIDQSENLRKYKRYFEGFTYRRYFLIVIVILVFFIYLGPYLIRWLFTQPPAKDPLLRCMDDRLTPFYLKVSEFNANIRHEPKLTFEKSFTPYTGNGLFGIIIKENAYFNIKYKRYLSMPIYYHPLIGVVTLPLTNLELKQSTVVDYLTGIVHKFECYEEYIVSYEYYAHRTIPTLLVQEMQITNTRNQVIDIELQLPHITDWPTAVTHTIKLQHGSIYVDYQVTTGLIELSRKSDTNKVMAVTIISRKLPREVTLKKRGIMKLELLININYSRPISRDEYAKEKDIIEESTINSMRFLLRNIAQDDIINLYSLKKSHTKVWSNLWSTGFQISSSKAEYSINGDRINATIYAVLSQVRSYEYEEIVTQKMKTDISTSLAYAEGCYDSYHTLQAENLWKDMDSLEDYNNLVSSWLLTLEKQGCHNLIKAGASGVIQAMVLSFGGFKFSNQHLELNIHPKYLHRDYSFRRLNYGNMTHINVSISVTDDNKAVLYVALDHSNSQYYACDAGCLDDPIPLTSEKQIFPVKLTEPLTAILYIASDKQHIFELRHAIHVKEVVEAPAHEHHVIALHKHGHHLGGLPTLFWVSICAIIIIFHVFLCKLIVKEYCDPPDKLRYRYSKP